MNRRDRRIAAKNSGAVPAPGHADSPDALHQAAMAHFRAGRPLDAQFFCQQALALDAEHAATLHLMGLLSLHTKQFDHAREWISRAIRRDAKPEYLASLATTLQEQGSYAEALQVIDKAVQLSPDNAELWRQLGDILVQQQRFDQALLAYQHVLALNPQHQDAHYKSGALLEQFDRHEDALAHLDRSKALLPSHAPTLEVRARSLFNLKRWDDALADAKRVDQLAPGNADTCNLIGMSLRSLGRHEEAVKWFDKALAVRPNTVEFLNSKIISLFDLHRFEEIFALYERMKSLKLNTLQTDWDVCLANLLAGNFEAGWRGHQSRLSLPSATYPKLTLPMWLGEESIEGKTILVASDEGLGDTMQFVRYVPMLAERGARVLLLVQDALYPLLSGLSGVAECVIKSAAATWPAIDFHCPVSSLPLAFGTRLDTIPSAPYLPEPAESCVQAWDNRLGSGGKLRVGLVWSGNPAHSNDHNRSIPLRTLARILDADARFVSLQKGPRPDDAAVLAERGDILDLTADLADFTDTAALISSLDLVITVDTSVAHLSGALGKPTWILLPYTPDYRWLLDRNDSPWYPSVRLFRQDKTRDYRPVLDRVRSELQALIAAK